MQINNKYDQPSNYHQNLNENQLQYNYNQSEQPYNGNPNYIYNGPREQQPYLYNQNKYDNTTNNYQSEYQTTNETSNNLNDNDRNLTTAIQATHQARNVMMHQNRDFGDSSFEAADFSDKKTRLGFIRKVFGILAVQLLITALVCVISLVSVDFRAFQVKNWYLLIVSSIISIAIIYVIVYTKLGRKVPINYILLFVFTICEAYTVSYIASKYEPATVALAAGLTCLITTGLSLYAAFTKTDFTKCGAFLLVCLIALIGGGIVGIFFKNKIFHLVLSVIGVIVFGLYLIFDIQLILGNKKNKMSKDDYVLAAMMLYIDIIQIFLYLLQILGIAGGN